MSLGATQGSHGKPNLNIQNGRLPDQAHNLMEHPSTHAGNLT